MPKRKRQKNPAPPRHQHSYRCARDVEEALAKYRASLEYDPGDNAIIDRALRLYLRSKGYDELPEREPPVH